MTSDHCDTCPHFAAHTLGLEPNFVHKGEVQGSCHINPPTPDPTPDAGSTWAMWPTMIDARNQWCSRHPRRSQEHRDAGLPS